MAAHVRDVLPGRHAAARWIVCCRVAGSLVILRWCFNRQPGDQDVQARSQQPFSVASSGHVVCEYTFLARTRVPSQQSHALLHVLLSHWH